MCVLEAVKKEEKRQCKKHKLREMTELGGGMEEGKKGKGNLKIRIVFFRKSFIKLPHRLEKREKFEKGLEGIISPHFGAQNQNKIKKESKIKIKNKSKKSQVPGTK